MSLREPGDDALDFAEDYARDAAKGPEYQDDFTCMSAGCDEPAEWKLGTDWLCDACNRREMRR